MQSRILIRVISISHYFLEASNGHIYSKEMPRVWPNVATTSAFGRGGRESVVCCPCLLTFSGLGDM